MNRILSLMLLLFVLSIGVDAQQGGMRKSGNRQMGMQGQMMGGGMHEKMMKQLNLTDQQKKAIDQSMMTAHKEVQNVQNQLNEAMAHQKTLMTSDNPDMQSIDKNLDKIGELKTDISKIHARHMVEVRSQLNDEQRMKFDKMQNNMINRMDRRGKMDMGNGMNCP